MALQKPYAVADSSEVQQSASLLQDLGQPERRARKRRVLQICATEHVT